MKKYSLFSYFPKTIALVIVFFMLAIPAELLAQRKKVVEERQPNEKLAKDLFAMRNFREALDEYLVLYKKDSKNLTYNYRVGICYLNLNVDRAKALPYLEFAVKNPKVDIEAWYELGRCYMYNYRFDDAINAFKSYQKLQKTKTDKFTIPAHRQIEMCRNAIELIKKPVNVTFHNLGNQINSAFPDFSPYIPADEGFLVFTSKRDNNIGKLLDFDGFYTSDVYLSSFRDNVWGKAKSIGTLINSDLVEEVGGLSADGNTLFVYIDNYDGFNDIVWTFRKGKSFQKPIKISPAINSNVLESSATVSPDKETIVFATEREDGMGGTDLYVSKKLPSGEWSMPQNVGKPLNTSYNEEFPNFSADGKVLYFASQGHNSMGGYDLFKSEYNATENTWSAPLNVGYPVNTPEDNMTISFSQSGRYAYIAAFRNDSEGDLDIYKLIFQDVEPPYSVIRGNILNSDSSNIYSFILPIDKKNDNTGIYSTGINDNLNLSNRDINVHIRVYDKATGKVIGKYLPNKLTGRYVVVLQPGEYKITFTGKGFKKYTEEVKIDDIGFFNNEIIKNIVLFPADSLNNSEESD